MPGESVLVIDDSPTILKLVQLVLTKAGYRVTTAGSGEAGLEAAKEEAPDIILLDYLLPTMNGDDVCRAMSGDATLAAVPVLVMSAREDAVGERFARIASVADYITKPFSPEALLAVIGHTLEKKNGAGDDSLPIVTVVPDERAPEEMTDPAQAALSGDLALISIADVLTLLQDQQQTGVLSLARTDARLDVFLRSGRIEFATARGVPEEFLLGRFVVDAGQVTADALARVVEERRRRPAGQPLLGADLISRGLLTPAGLRKAMAMQTSALVFEGLRWGGGRFHFHARELPPLAQDAALALPVDGLIMEGLRRVDEWRLIEREIGDFDLVLVRDEERLSSFGRDRLLREEAAVLDFVNGRNSVKEIIYAANQNAKMGSFDVTKMLYRLLRNKLIRRRVAPIAA
jgi:DNA-binding response OmpR family regulator